MALAMGTVKSTVGYVIARADGEERVLSAGDIVNEGDLVVTSPGSNIVITLTNGEELQLDGGQTLAMDSSLINNIDAGDAEAEALAIQEALEQGQNIEDLEQATATGDDPQENLTTYSFLPGDTSQGDVGSYLLGSEGNQGFQGDDFQGTGDEPGGNNNQTPAAGQAGTNNAGSGTTGGGTSGGGTGGTGGGSAEEPVPGEATNPDAVADTVTLLEDSSIDINVTANDENITGVESVTQPENGTVTLNDDGTVTYTPAENYTGSDSFTYTVTDADGNTDTATVNITVNPVNDGPVAEDDSAEVAEDASITISVLDNDTDIEGDELSVVSVTQPENGTVTVNEDGTVTYTPTENYNGTDSFTYTITDGEETSTATVNLTVNPENDAPVAVDDIQTVDEDGSVNINVLTNDTDLDGDTVFVSGADETSENGGTVVVQEDGTITYTPAPNFNGTDTFTYTISDGNGGTDTATVTVNVGAVNDGPDAVEDGITTDEDTAINIPVLDNDTDLDGDTVFVSGADETSENGGTVTVNADGTITYTPAPNFNGTDTFTYTISDGNGGTDTATVTVNVGAVNDGPDAVEDGITTDEDTAINIPVLDNDTDLDGDTVFVSGADETSENGGTVTVNADGTITYTPAPNFNGTDTFTYTISDGNGGTDTATVTVNVGAVNDGPDAVEDGITTDEDTAINIPVLDNDTDLDGDTVFVSGADETSENGGTVVVQEDGTITYTPAPNFNGTDTFTYTISDGNGGTDTATVTVNVGAVNDGPDAVEDGITTDEDTAINIPVLDNDTDLDGDTVFVSGADETSENGGTVTVNADGTITYTPAANFNGTDTFTYTISDGNGGTDTATVTVNVGAVNDGPDAVEDGITTDEDTAINIPVLDNDTDLDGDTVFVSGADETSENGGTVVVQEDGTITYTPAPNFNGTDTFTYTISDGNGGTDTATVTVNVGAVNDAPETSDKGVTVGANGEVAFDLSDFDEGGAKDIEDDASADKVTSVVIDTLPEHGTLYYTEDDGSLTEITDTGVTVDDVTRLTYQVDEGYNSTIIMGTDESQGVVGQWGEVENGVLTYEGANGITATISAANADGSSVDVGFNNQINRQEGLGVGVDGGGDDGQIDTNETLTVSFNAAVSNVVIGLGGLGYNFDTDNSHDAEAHWVAYDADGNVVSEGFVQRGDDYTAEIDLDGVTFNSIEFFNVSTGGNSNFVVQYIEYTNADLTDSFDYHAVDSDGAESNVSTVTLTMEQGPAAEYNVAPEAESDTISLNSDSGYTADFSLAQLTSDYEDDNDGNPETVTSITIESLPEHGTLYLDGEEVQVGQVIEDASQLQYVLDGDTETVSVLMGSKGEGTIDNWGTYNEADGTISFEAGDVTATISSPDGDIGFNDYSGINKQEGFGLGVAGSGDDGQVDLGETLVIDFDSAVSNATVGLAGLGQNFGGSIDAYAHWEALDANGNVVASGDVQADNDEINSFTIDGVEFSQIVFSVTNTTINSNFTVQYIELNAVSSDSFDYSVTDSGDKGSNVATITFDIEPSEVLTAEHAPVAEDDSAELMENSSVVIDVLANDSDIDGDDLEVSVNTNPEHGTVEIIDGQVVYTPAADYEGTDTFTYTITDPDGNSDTATVSLNVLHENEAPVITVTNTETTVTYVSEEASYNNVIGLYAMNEAGEPVLVQILEENGNYGSGNFQIDPADGDFGTYVGDGSDLHFFIIANGNVGDVDYSSIQFVDNGNGYTAYYANGDNTVAINRPVYFDNAEMNPGEVNHFQTTVNEDGTITIGVEDLAPASSDEDYDDVVMKLESGTVTFVEDGEAVSIANDVTITDDDSSTMTTMTVTLNNPLADDVMSLLGDLPEGITADTSVPNQITFTNTAEDPSTVSIADFEDALKLVTYENTSQDPDQTPREFDVSVTDDTGLTSNLATFNVNVVSVNDAPDAGDDAYQTTEDIDGYTFNALVNDSDVEGDVTISTYEQPANGTVVLNADGTFTYTPDADYNGTDTFTYQVADEDGTLSEPATVTIVVDPVNDAPVVTVNDVETTVTFNSVNTGAGYTNAFGVYFTDAEGNPVNGEILVGNSKGEINADLGSYDTASSNVHFFLISNIGAGGYEEGEVTFEMVNGKPVMSIDGAEVTKNVFYSETEFNKDGKDHFAVTENEDGSVTITAEDLYNVAAGTSGTDFTVDVNETVNAAVFTEDGGAVHIVQDVDVTDVDDTTMHEMTVTLENYQAGEDVLSVDESMLPEGLNYSITDGVITFSNEGAEMSNEAFAQAVESVMYNNTSDTPNDTDREFTVQVSDGEAWSNVADITVEVVPVNDAPDAGADSIDTDEDTSVTIPVLDNDTDLDGDTVFVSGADETSANGGTVTVNADGTITYTPAEDFNGTDTFTYSISDGNGGTDTATVTVNVGPANDGPQAVDDVNAISDVDTGSNVNIVIALDTSGSMFHDRYGDIHGEETRLQIALDSLEEMLSSYEPQEVGGIMLVEFFGDVSTNTGENGVWLTYEEAVDLVQNFEIPTASNLNTDYDSALQMIMDNYSASSEAGTIPAADETVMYFLSDGSPNGYDYSAGHYNSNSLSSSEAAVWNEFADANFSHVYAVGVGVNAATSQLALVAGENGQVLIVNDETGLAETLLNLADNTKVVGNVLVNDTDTEDIDWSDSSNGTNVQLTVTGAAAGAETDDSVAQNNMNEDGSITVEGQYGTLTINSDGSYVYTLDVNNPAVEAIGEGESELDNFSYTVRDSGGATDIATLSITVNGVNDAPVANDTAASGDEDTSILIDVSGDFSDADGDASVTDYTQPENGTVVQNSDGTFTYTPADDFSGEDTFTYTVTDAQGAESTATVNVTVNPVADAPAVSLSISEATEVEPQNLIVNGSFEDVTGVASNGYTVNNYDVNNGGYKAMKSITGWDLIGDPSETSNTMEIHDAGHMSVGATDGENYMDLGETNSGGDGDLDNTHIGQVVSGVADGVSYTLTFDYTDKAAAANNDASGALEVYWGGQLVAELDGDNTDWATYTVDVIGGAGDGSNLLEFKEVGTGYDNHGMAIDNVQLTGTVETVQFTLTLDAAVTDTNGEVSYESLNSLTLSGLPEGAELSLGTDNGDGTWTIDATDLTTYHGEVTMTVPAGTADFDIKLSASAVESGNGDVSALADAVVHVDLPEVVADTNEAPFIDLNGEDGVLDFSEETTDYSTTYVIGSDAGVAIADADLYIADLDDTQLASMTIAITGGLVAGVDALQIDLSILDGTGLTATFNDDYSQLTLASSDGSAVNIEHFENALGSVTFTTDSDSQDAREISVTVTDAQDSTLTSTAMTNISIDVPYAPETVSMTEGVTFEAYAHKGHTYGNNNEYAPSNADNADLVSEDGYYAVRSVEDGNGQGHNDNNTADDFDIDTDEAIVFHTDDATSMTFDFDGNVAGGTWTIYDGEKQAIDMDDANASVTIGSDGHYTFTSDVPFQYIIFDGGSNGEHGNSSHNNTYYINSDASGDSDFAVKPIEYQAADTADISDAALDNGSIDFSNVESYGHIDVMDMTDGQQQSTSLSIDTVLDMTDADNVLMIRGDSGDSVTLEGDWSYNHHDGVFTANDGSGAQVHVEGDFSMVNFDNDTKIITFDNNDDNSHGC